MIVHVGKKSFDISQHAEILELHMLYADGWAQRLYILASDGSMWTYIARESEDDLEYGHMPVGVYDVTESG